MRVSRACADANGDGMHGYTIVRKKGDSTVLAKRVA
jgi:hypothetical protein